MKKLSKAIFNEAAEFINKEGRSLEKTLFNYYFNNLEDKELVKELKKYQNSDGGFGNALESDYRLPLSSPMATSVAFQHLLKVDQNEEALNMIKAAIKYLEDTYVKDRKGWFAVPSAVNEYPHTPWWNFNEENGMSEIDKNWGNPNAELIGYLYKYRNYVKRINVNELVDNAINYFINVDKIESFHEIYCYIELYKMLPENLAGKIESKLNEAVEALVCKDSSQWKNSYVAKPLDFVHEKEYKFNLSEDLINLNLDYLVNTLEENKIIEPSWGKFFYEGEFESAWNEWIGVLTLKALILLDKFNRIA